jgi:hypothetical protein
VNANQSASASRRLSARRWRLPRSTPHYRISAPTGGRALVPLALLLARASRRLTSAPGPLRPHQLYTAAGITVAPVAPLGSALVSIVSLAVPGENQSSHRLHTIGRIGR